MAIAVRSKCDATNTKVGWDAWGARGIPCQTRVGLRSFIDRQGTPRFACAAPGHFANVERRFGHLPIAEACFICGRLAPILDGVYQRIQFEHGIANVCDTCVERGDDAQDSLIVEDRDAYVVTADYER